MVIIAKDFNEDMDAYIRRLRTQQPKPEPVQKQKYAKSSAKVPELSEEEIYIEYEEPSGFSGWLSGLFRPKNNKAIPEDDELDEQDEEELEALEEEIEEVEHQAHVLEQRQESLIAAFLRKMRISRRHSPPLTDEELLDDVVPVIDEEVKETLKMLHTWLEKLPNQDLRAFRVSEDFQNYKKVLDKYGLIKK